MEVDARDISFGDEDVTVENERAEFDVRGGQKRRCGFEEKPSYWLLLWGNRHLGNGKLIIERKKKVWKGGKRGEKE